MSMTLEAPTLEDPGYFDRLAEIETRHWWSLGMWRLAEHWLDSALRGRSNLVALDLGCGTGFNVARLIARPEVVSAIGIEPSATALRFAPERADTLFLQGDALALPLGPSAVDVITCFDVIQHVDNPAQAMAEVARVLRPGGVVLVRTNGRGWSGDESAYTRARLNALLAGAGLILRRSSHGNFTGAFVQELRGQLSSLATRRVDSFPRSSVGMPSSTLGVERSPANREEDAERRGRHSRAERQKESVSLLKRWRSKSRVQPHPSGGGLRIRMPSPRINQAMTQVARFEAFLAGKLRVRLPFGHSTLALAEKPAG